MSPLLTKDLVAGTETVMSDERAARIAWSRDSRFLGVIQGSEDGLERLVRLQADGSGGIEPLTAFVNPGDLHMGYWSADDSVIVTGTDTGLNVFRPGQDTAAAVLLDAGEVYESPTLFPDGHWVAYQSFVDGEGRIFVRPFPNADDRRMPISVEDGTEPRWSSDGSELFYVRQVPGAVQLVAATVQTLPEFTVLGREPLFNTQTGIIQLGGGWSYDPHHQGASRAKALSKPARHSVTWGPLPGRLRDSAHARHRHAPEGRPRKPLPH